MSFSSKPFNSSGTAGFNNFLRRNPVFFGLPFILIIVGASFGLKRLTNVGVEKKDTKVTAVSQV
jgi:cytochrome c oxidase assembly protein subunit 16